MQPGRVTHLILALWTILAAAAGAAQDVPVVLIEDGKPQATVVIDSARYPRQEDLTNRWQTVERTIRNIVGTVNEYLEKSTGASLPVVDLAGAAAPGTGALLYIGRGDFVDKALGAELDDLDPSGYIIRAVDERTVVVAGTTPEGTEYGTYEFLERFVGVRWLMPTEVGEHVPELSRLQIPGDTSIRDEPEFMQVPGIAFQPTHRAWARRMRFYTRLNFHHNLVRLLPPSMYKTTHPEFFPLRNPGDTERYLPPTDDTEAWQPCFTAPGIVDEAANRIIERFNQGSEIRSYSLGVNDSGGYCQCERCRAEYVEGESFLGQPCYSDAYYKFCNAVVEKVLKVHPDIWFGCLAYSNVGAPPVNVQVHPRIIPFLTYDTMQLVDPKRRKQHEELVQAWNEKCTFLGRYDYTYGDHHVPPRIYVHHWAEYVRWARDHNVRAWYAETYPFFGEAPKYYVMAKIWWDPDRDVDAILDEWYRLSFGKAAPPMRAYFDHWEDYWTRRVPKTAHFVAMQNAQYLLGHTGWLQGLERADLDEGDRLIAQALELADTPQTRARVEVMALAWEYYRTVIETYVTAGETRTQMSVDQALKVLSMAPTTVTTNLTELREKLDEHPILIFSWVRDFPYGAALRAPLLDAIQAFLSSHDEGLAARLRELAGDDDATLSARAKTALDIAEGRAENLTPNAGFEAEKPLDGWWAGSHFGTGKVTLTQERPHRGENAVVVRSTWDGYGGVFRTDVPVKPGKTYFFALRARWEGEPAEGTLCQMLTQFRDATGRTLPESLTVHQFKCTGEWLVYMLETPVVPQDATSLVARVDAMVQPRTGHAVYFDDLEVYEIGR